MGVESRRIEALRERAAVMRESLRRVEENTDNMVTILGSFDHRLSGLEAELVPSQIQTHSLRKANENIDKALKVAEVILGQFDIAQQAEAKIARVPHEDLESYLKTVDELKTIIKFLSGKKSYKSSIGVATQANNLLEKAIVKLGEEFGHLITTYSKPVQADHLYDCLPRSMRPSVASSGERESNTKESFDDQNKNQELLVYQLPTLLPPRIVPMLRNIALQMIQAGQQHKVLIFYREARSSAIEQTLMELGVERLNKEDVQRMQWEVLEAKIGNWTTHIRIAFKFLFPGEKNVCDVLFEGNGNLKDQCFAQATTKSVTMIFSLGEAVARSKRLPEKLFVLLDMYEIMVEIRPEVDTIFGSTLCSEVREASVALTKRLAQAAREIFGDFQELVEKDISKTAATNGSVHPLTSYVVNYVKFLVDYRTTLLQLFKEFSDTTDAEEQLTAITTRIIQALLSNLDGKSKQYRDPGLSHLFLMNNIHYIVRSVRRSDAKDLLGTDWVQIHRRVVQQHANQYKRICWAKILQSLTIQGSQHSGDYGSSSNISKQTVKDRLKTFNTLFEEIHLRQSEWMVPDTELCESLRLTVAEILLPAYRSFLKRFGPVIQSSKSPQKYIKYSAEDLERMLGDFFEGST